MPSHDANSFYDHVEKLNERGEKLDDLNEKNSLLKVIMRCLLMNELTSQN